MLLAGQHLREPTRPSSPTLRLLTPLRPHPILLIALAADLELRQEDIIPNTPSLIVYSRRGYIKRMRADTFDVQRLGGKGA